MARTAAAKKVAKAASAGGGVKGFRARRNLLFPGAMLLVVALGVVLILFARLERAENAPAGPPRVGDHWHSLYSVYDCDQFTGDIYPNDVNDFSGIHTHGDGLIHIHPRHGGVTGQFATVGAFMREIEFELSDGSLQLPDRSFLDESNDLCASPDPDSSDPAVSQPGAELRILRWETLQAEKAVSFSENLRDVRFLSDGQLFVFARVHPATPDADIPRPDDSFLRSYLNLPAEEQPLLGEGVAGGTEEVPVESDPTLVPFGPDGETVPAVPEGPAAPGEPADDTTPDTTPAGADGEGEAEIPPTDAPADEPEGETSSGS